MGVKDKRVDAYIEKAQPFAKPILRKLRALIHKGNPDMVETIKWGMPSFEYKGPCCGFAAFKQHATFGFWKYKLIEDPNGYLSECSNQGGAAMGNLGRIMSKADLPPDRVIVEFVRQAKKLNDDGVKLPPRQKKARKELNAPDSMMAAIRRDRRALETFEKFSPSHRREYIEWITEAKTDATRDRRMATMVEWLAEGKPKNWKYMRKKFDGSS